MTWSTGKISSIVSARESIPHSRATKTAFGLTYSYRPSSSSREKPRNRHDGEPTAAPVVHHKSYTGVVFTWETSFSSLKPYGLHCPHEHGLRKTFEFPTFITVRLSLCYSSLSRSLLVSLLRCNTRETFARDMCRLSLNIQRHSKPFKESRERKVSWAHNN